MQNTDKKVIVTKHPLARQNPVPPIKFKPMPVLYLELLENKDKVVPELRTKQYDSMNATEKLKAMTTNTTNNNNNAYSAHVQAPISVSTTLTSNNSYNNNNNNNNNTNNNDDDVADEESDMDEDDYDDDEKEYDYDDESDEHQETLPTQSTENNINNNNPTFIPPSLNTVDSDKIKKEQNEQDVATRRKELLFRFNILRKGYKGQSIPEFTEYSDVDMMQSAYDDTLRNLKLDASVNSYKQYLTMGFMGLEVMLVRYFKFESAEGLAACHSTYMDQYDQLLVELGEKTYLSGMNNMPVEVRLLMMIVINTIIFIGSKTIMSSVIGNNSSSSTTNTQQPASGVKIMKGPPKDFMDDKED
jgi:hypothetical protein